MSSVCIYMERTWRGLREGVGRCFEGIRLLQMFLKESVDEGWRDIARGMMFGERYVLQLMELQFWEISQGRCLGNGMFCFMPLRESADGIAVLGR